MTSTDLMREIQIEISAMGYRAWRNNVGLLWDRNGDRVRVGLAEGSSDLIGIGPGGRFLSIEVKPKKGRKNPTDTQSDWIEMVTKLGGLGGVARSVEDAVRITMARHNGG